MRLLFAFVVLTLVAGMSVSSFAHPGDHTTLLQLDDKTAVQTKITTMTVPPDQNLKWATISGDVPNAVDWYPVIIQIYKQGTPIHFAQVDLTGPNLYEYQFPIKSDSNGSILDIFKGEYTVKVSAVIYHKAQNDSYL